MVECGSNGPWSLHHEIVSQQALSMQKWKGLKGCCAPILNGIVARSPEELMRSRYTAYVTGSIDTS